MFVPFFYSLLFPFVLGYVCVAGVFPKLSECLKLGLSYGFGMGVIATWVFLLGSVNVLPLIWPVMNIPLCAVACVLFWKCLSNVNARSVDIQRQFSGLEWSLLIFIVVNFMLVFFVATAYSVYGWDAIATVVFKSKVFFFERSFEFNQNLPHASYPFHVSLMYFWIAANFSQWNDTVIKIVQPCFYGSLLLLLYGVLRNFISRTYALLGVGLLVSSAFPLFHATVAYTDLILSYYMCGALWILILGFNQNKPKFFLISGLFAALACFVKYEGLIGMGVMLLLYGSSLIRSRLKSVFFKEHIRNLVALCGPAIALYFYFTFFKSAYGVPMGEPGRTVLVLSSHLVANMIYMLRLNVINFTISANWGGNFYIFFLVCFAQFYVVRREMSFALRCGGLCILFFIAAQVALFIFTPALSLVGRNIYEPMSRLILQYFPLIPFTSAIALEQIFLKNGSS